jgi:putative sigma-54 modulation protein
MKVKIVERHTGSSDMLRKYVLKKTDGLNRYFDRIISIDVVLMVEKERQIADFHAHLTNRKLIKAREESSDMYASVDMAVDKLKRQLVKYKDHLTDHSGGAPVNEMDEGEETGQRREIIRSRTYFQKPMTPEEAALQLDALEKNFLVFIDAETDEVSVIYHRQDGAYGLIEPRR